MKRRVRVGLHMNRLGGLFLSGTVGCPSSYALKTCTLPRSFLAARALAKFQNTNGSSTLGESQYVPEFANVSPDRIHAPHLVTREEQAGVGCRIGADYPSTIVDHRQAGEECLTLTKQEVIT